MTQHDALGKIEVSRQAIAGVVANAVTSCYGVVALAPGSRRAGLVAALRRGRPDHGIELRIDEGRLTIDVHVVVEYGTRIAEVGRNVAEAVQFAVERAIGMPVARVNVHVQGLRVSDRP